jgi:hypothetical protein
MKKQAVVAGLAAVAAIAGTGTLSAQASACPIGGSPVTISGAQANVARDACLQAVDLFQFVAPQLGLALTGGNATIGQGSTMGGLGHFSIGVRGNVFSGDLPQVTDFPSPRNQQNPPSETLPSKKQVFGLPVADAAIGIFKGIPLPLTNVGGIDVLLSATYVPNIGDSTNDVQIKPQNNFKFGYGFRLGLLQESLIVPGVSFTFLKRDVPTTDIIGRSGAARINVDSVDIKTTAWRLVASKSFIMFGLAAGVGQDKYDQSATVSGLVNAQSITVGQTTVTTGPQSFGPVNVSQSIKRTNGFVDVSLNLPIFKVVLEGGAVGGASPTIPQVNSFSSGKADDSRLYGSLGIRLSW